MFKRRSTWRLAGLIAIAALILAGCTATTPQSETPPSPSAQAAFQSILPTPSAQTEAQSVLPSPIPQTVVQSVLPTPAVAPTPMPAIPGRGLSLVVLHTNDNWGETEPCG